MSDHMTEMYQEALAISALPAAPMPGVKELDENDRTTFGPQFFTDVGRDPDKWVKALWVRTGTDVPSYRVLRDFFDAALSALGVPAHPEGVKAHPFTYDEVEQIIETTEPATLSDKGDRIWTRRMAVALADKFNGLLTLSHPEPVAQEAVAWRWRHVPTVRWSYSDTKHPREDLEQQPLYDASTASPSIAREEAREIGWLIERKYPHSIGLTEPRWYAERGPDGWHWWTQDASEAKRFASKAEVEAFLAYRMIVNDPTISVTEHVFLASTAAPAEPVAQEAVADMERLGTEFEKAWDENTDQLYESAPASPPEHGEDARESAETELPALRARVAELEARATPQDSDAVRAELRDWIEALDAKIAETHDISLPALKTGLQSVLATLSNQGSSGNG